METTNNIIITIGWLAKNTIELFAKSNWRDGEWDVLDRCASQDGGVKVFANFIASAEIAQIEMQWMLDIHKRQSELVQASQNLISVSVE